MRYLSNSIQAILLIAVAFLYYLHFKKEETIPSAAGDMPKSIPATHGIVYVNSDSLLDQYDFYKSKKKEFEDAQERIKRELKSESDKLQQEMELYQQQAIGMTDMQRMQKEEQLTMKQQQLMQKKDNMLEKLDEQQNSSSDELYNRLHEFFSKYNKERNYSFILGFQKGGGILFANDTLNITREVIDGLNKEYSGKK